MDFSDVDWTYVLRMLAEELDVGGGISPEFDEVAEERLGPVEWSRVQDLFVSPDRGALVHLSDAAQAVLFELARSHTPLRRFVFRSTRELLRRYRDKGVLQENIPRRDPKPVWIAMREDERRLYERIDEYISGFYQKYESERKGLGFVMTVYRRRLTSSFAAIEKSLQRRLDYLEGRAGTLGLTDEDREDEELDDDIDEALEEVDPRVFQAEINYVQDFLADLRALQGDSKWEHFKDEIEKVLERRDSVIVFTQYADTLDDLREKLAPIHGPNVACYSGRGGEVYDAGEWRGTTKEEVKNAFLARDVKILLCTEAASEGLNLQTCGVLINYDMPWNPMRVEQRIGRIDRIGQVHEVVWVRNYFYEDTVEADVYRRLEDRIDWFTTVVGELQPILTQVARTIERLALTPADRRQVALVDAVELLRRDIDERRSEGFAIEDFAAAGVQTETEPPPVTLKDLQDHLLGHAALARSFKPHPEVAGAYQLSWQGKTLAVTWDPRVFDIHPQSVRLLTYGNEIVEALLHAVPPPRPVADGPVVRVAAEEDVAWFCSDEGSVSEVKDLEGLNRALAGPPLSGEQLGEARARVNALVSERVRRQWESDAAHLRAEVMAMQDRGRQILLQATYVDLVRSRLAHQEGYITLDFSEDAIVRTASSGFPFSALSQLVGIDELELSPADPEFARLDGLTETELVRRRAALVQEGGDVVRAIVELRKHAIAPEPEAEPFDVSVSIFRGVTS